MTLQSSFPVCGEENLVSLQKWAMKILISFFFFLSWSGNKISVFYLSNFDYGNEKTIFYSNPVYRGDSFTPYQFTHSSRNCTLYHHKKKIWWDYSLQNLATWSDYNNNLEVAITPNSLYQQTRPIRNRSFSLKKNPCCNMALFYFRSLPCLHSDTLLNHHLKRVQRSQVFTNIWD